MGGGGGGLCAPAIPVPRRDASFVGIAHAGKTAGSGDLALDGNDGRGTEGRNGDSVTAAATPRRVAFNLGDALPATVQVGQVGGAL